MEIKTICCIFNGSKKKPSALNSFLSLCKQTFGDSFSFFSTEYSGHAIRLASENVSNFDLFLIIGGDGTVNEILNGILNSSNQKQAIIAVIPFGTGNDFCRSANLKIGFNNFLNALNEGKIMECDAGIISNGKDSKYFINVADIGFGGNTVLELTKLRKKFGASFSYSLAILKTFLKYKKPLVKIESGEFSYAGPLLLAACCNGAIFGNGLHVHPKALVNDGIMNITVLAEVSLLDYLLNVFKVKNGKKIKHKGAFYFVANSFELTSLSGLIHVETDGEYFSGTNFQVNLVPNAIRLLYI